MISTGKLKNRPRGAWLLFILFSLALACLVCAQAAESRASDGKYVATDWVRRYKGPTGNDRATAIAVDGQGNIYVTGSSDSVTLISDIVTIKYSPDGQRLWARRYHSPENHDDYAVALAVDGQGNVYVTGYSVTWRGKYGEDTIFVTIKYDTNGQFLWVRNYNGIAVGIAVDAQGNVYVTGASDGGATGTDYATIKYSPDGEEIWVRRHNSPGNYNDAASGIILDGQGNVYVTGTENNGEIWNSATIKYSPDGRKLWLRRYRKPLDGKYSAHALAVDGQGNVYVTGVSESRLLGTGYDYATIKYSPEGQRLWVGLYNGPGNYEDWAIAIAVDAQGNVLVTGRSFGSGTDHDYATIKYSPAGKKLWVRRYNGPGNGWDQATALALDGQGNVYVTGGSWGPEEKYESATIKYGPDGRRLWLRRYAGDGGNVAWAMATDAQANVLITGYTVITGKGYGYLTIKYGQTP